MKTFRQHPFASATLAFVALVVAVGAVLHHHAYTLTGSYTLRLPPIDSFAASSSVQLQLRSTTPLSYCIASPTGLDIQSAHTGRSVVTTCCWRSSLTRTRDSLISCGAAHTFFGERPASLRQLALSATVALLFTACPHTRSRVRLRSTETYGRASLPLQGSAYLL